MSVCMFLGCRLCVCVCFGDGGMLVFFVLYVCFVVVVVVKLSL